MTVNEQVLGLVAMAVAIVAILTVGTPHCRRHHPPRTPSGRAGSRSTGRSTPAHEALRRRTRSANAARRTSGPAALGVTTVISKVNHKTAGCTGGREGGWTT